MAKDPTLSEEVQAYIDTLDFESRRDIPLAEREEAEKNRRLVQFIVETTVKSREMITDAKLRVVEQLVTASPDLIADFLDDYFTRQMVEAIPGYVGRTLQLSRLEAQQVPSQITNGYLREAVRTYILGLPQACVALCRAALEQAIKEKMGYRPTRANVQMKQLLDEAETAGVLDHTVRKMASQIAEKGNEVLHEKPTTLPEAFDVLVQLRGVLLHIYEE